MGPWNPDFEEFFASLTSTGVELLRVGGVAYDRDAPGPCRYGAHSATDRQQRMPRYL